LEKYTSTLPDDNDAAAYWVPKFAILAGVLDYNTNNLKSKLTKYSAISNRSTSVPMRIASEEEEEDNLQNSEAELEESSSVGSRSDNDDDNRHKKFNKMTQRIKELKNISNMKNLKINKKSNTLISPPATRGRMIVRK
jgi:hypothetical protein